MASDAVVPSDGMIPTCVLNRGSSEQNCPLSETVGSPLTADSRCLWLLSLKVLECMSSSLPAAPMGRNWLCLMVTVWVLVNILTVVFTVALSRMIGADAGLSGLMAPLP